MAEKTWKDALLGSGQPLEHEVSRALQAAGFETATEYSYLRKNEHGIVTEFSVDFQASLISTMASEGFGVDFFIESKYKRPGTSWVFCPEKEGDDIHANFSDLFITLSNACPHSEVDRNYIQQFANRYRYANRGVELFDRDHNNKTIKEALSQIQHAIPHGVGDALEHQIDNLLGSPSPIWFIVPIIVTTAQLFILKEDASVDTIFKSEKLDEVCDPVDFLVHFSPPNNLLTAYTSEVLQSSLNDVQKARFNSLQPSGEINEWNSFVSHFSRYYPSHTVFIHSSRFPETMKRLVAFFTDAPLLVPKS